MNKITLNALCLLFILSITGCEGGFGTFVWNSKKQKPDVEDGFVDADIDNLTQSLSYRDTIAEQGWVEGLRKMKVRGYGVVAGLGTSGSKECPRRIRSQLIQDMYKRKEFAGTGIKPALITPEQFLADLDTAVVIIEGEIPAAVTARQSFDVTVTALPGTQTTSLEGGTLYTSNLYIYRETSATTSVKGKALATAHGPVFINPFAGDEKSATKRNPRQGTVIGGGTATESRKLRLVLTQPSYQKARRITLAVNERFGGASKIAEATSPSYINLRVPEAFTEDPFHFLAILRHLYLPDYQGFKDKRTRDLAQEITVKTAPGANIALAWEGIGRQTLPIIQKLYTHELPHVRFYSAIAGFRMGDDVAVEVLEQFATNPTSPFRQTAIEEFGRNRKSFRAAVVLRKLLNDRDPRIRVQTYEALLARNDRIIETKNIADGKISLDIVPSKADNIIYVRRTKSPRIVLIGSAFNAIPPVFYQSPNSMITVNAPEKAENLTLIRRTPFADQVSPPIYTSFDIAELIDMLGDDPLVNSKNEVHGLAVDYSTITHALYKLCSTNSINAKFMLQRPSVIDLFGPLQPNSRKESDFTD